MGATLLIVPPLLQMILQIITEDTISQKLFTYPSKFLNLGVQISPTVKEQATLALREYQHGTVLRSCAKSSCEISSLSHIPESTVSGLITEWIIMGRKCATYEIWWREDYSSGLFLLSKVQQCK